MMALKIPPGVVSVVELGRSVDVQESMLDAEADVLPYPVPQVM